MARGKKRVWILYGANGYTGALIARHAVQRGLHPVLAGRSGAAVSELATRLGLEARIFDLANSGTIERQLGDAALVLNCAGPFDETCVPMAEAAIEARCHYLDISGEIGTYEALRARGERARRARVMLLPGVGFDTVPTDCLASRLHRALPDADRLELAFVGPNEAAAGSLKTALRQMPRGSAVREDGVLEAVPFFSRARTLHLEGRAVTVHAIPWGDLVSAHASTGIPNIVVYTRFPPAQLAALRLARPLMGALANRTVRAVAEAAVEALDVPPDDRYLEHGRTLIWGETSSDAGAAHAAVIETRDTYSVTREASILIVERLLGGGARPGFRTVSRLFGPDLVFELSRTRLLAEGPCAGSRPRSSR